MENSFETTTTNGNRDEWHLNECVDIHREKSSELFDDKSDNKIITEDVYSELLIEKKKFLKYC